MARRKHFWENREPSAQRRFFKFALLSLAVLFVAAWAGLDYMNRSVHKNIASMTDEYGRVVNLVREVTVLRAGQGDLSSLEPATAVEHLLSDYGKFPPALVVSHGSELDVTFPGIPLSDLTTFLSDVRSRTNLQAKSFEVEASGRGMGLLSAHIIFTR